MKCWIFAPLCRAAVLERMPVIEKTSSGQTNGEPTGELIKDNQPAQVKQAEPLVLQQPANQVRYTDRSVWHKANRDLWNVSHPTLGSSLVFLVSWLLSIKEPPRVCAFMEVLVKFMMMTYRSNGGVVDCQHKLCVGILSVRAVTLQMMLVRSVF